MKKPTVKRAAVLKKKKPSKSALSRIGNYLKHHFIPHRGNDHHPHVLRTGWSLAYGALFLGLKGAVVAYAVLLPVQAYLAPDVLEGQRAKIETLTNGLRKEKNVPPLAVVAKLETSAQKKADDMAEKSYFSHQSPDGHGLSYFLGRAGYKYSDAGENLAMGFSDAESLVGAWIKSAKHYANLVDPEFTQFGVGMEEGKYDGKETVFVAGHFAMPYAAVVDPPAETPAAPTPAPVPKPDPIVPPVPVPEASPSAQIAVAVPKPKAPPSPKPVTFVPVAVAMPKTVKPTPKPVVPAPVVPTPVVAAVPVEPAPAPVEAELAPPVPIAVAAPAASNLVYQRERSHVDWQDLADGRVHVDATIAARGDLTNVNVSIQGYPVDLVPDPGTPGVFVGSMTVPESSENLFRAVVDPTVTFTDTQGRIVRDTVEWSHVKVVNPTPWQKYAQARDWFSVVPSVFSATRMVYAVFLSLFTAVLAAVLIVEYRRQRAHMVVRAVSMFLLVFFLWRF